MPLFTSPEHTIILREDTGFIINQYHNSLVETGFIVPNKNEEKTCDYLVADGVTFAQELLVPGSHNRGGIKNAAARIVGKVTHNEYGGKTQTIPQVQFNLDSQTLVMHQDYCTEWGKVVTQVNIVVVREHYASNQEMSRNKINNVHILTMTLISRLVAYVISDEHMQRVDHLKLFHAIHLFIKKITGEGSSFKKNERLVR
ncbi:MAG: hypothetical protein BGO90_02970 [Legionella sp. 40-6]|nr:MAG: hypothetical protein BGO90_02970 [Legionella sp. 40-6]